MDREKHKLEEEKAIYHSQISGKRGERGEGRRERGEGREERGEGRGERGEGRGERGEREDNIAKIKKRTATDLIT